MCIFVFFFQAEDGIRDLVRSRGLGDVYKRQAEYDAADMEYRGLGIRVLVAKRMGMPQKTQDVLPVSYTHLTLPTSDLV